MMRLSYPRHKSCGSLNIAAFSHLNPLLHAAHLVEEELLLELRLPQDANIRKKCSQVKNIFAHSFFKTCHTYWCYAHKAVPWLLSLRLKFCLTFAATHLR
ncbi:hypothetical protein AMECASPLE_024095 [Ameca splendens]|uniref:Uncharacterized protein n=1 Tax=Ameca splendens TaxID=208324 RepID=A0ABV0Z2A3_9TELE